MDRLSGRKSHEGTFSALGTRFVALTSVSNHSGCGVLRLLAAPDAPSPGVLVARWPSGRHDRWGRGAGMGVGHDSMPDEAIVLPGLESGLESGLRILGTGLDHC